MTDSEQPWKLKLLALTAAERCFYRALQLIILGDVPHPENGHFSEKERHDLVFESIHLVNILNWYNEPWVRTNKNEIWPSTGL